MPRVCAQGLAMNESVLPATGGFGGKPTMTSIAPKWAEQVRQGLLRPALFGDSVTQDNVGAPLYGPPNGCCDVRSNSLFLQQQRAALGLPANFSMGPFIQSLRRHGLSGIPLVQHPVVREIIRFHFVENLRRWRATYNAIKADAAEGGRPEPAVYGNAHIVESAAQIPPLLVLSMSCDRSGSDNICCCAGMRIPWWFRSIWT